MCGIQREVDIKIYKYYVFLPDSANFVVRVAAGCIPAGARIVFFVVHTLVSGSCLFDKYLVEPLSIKYCWRRLEDVATLRVTVNVVLCSIPTQDAHTKLYLPTLLYAGYSVKLKNDDDFNFQIQNSISYKF